MIRFNIKSPSPAEGSRPAKTKGAVKKTVLHYIKSSDQSLIESFQFMYVSVLRPAQGEYIQLRNTWYRVKLVSFTYTFEEDDTVQNIHCFLDVHGSTYDPSSDAFHPAYPL